MNRFLIALFYILLTCIINLHVVIVSKLKKILDHFFFPSFAEAKFHVFIHLKFEGGKGDTEKFFRFSFELKQHEDFIKQII